MTKTKEVKPFDSNRVDRLSNKFDNLSLVFGLSTMAVALAAIITFFAWVGNEPCLTGLFVLIGVFLFLLVGSMTFYKLHSRAIGKLENGIGKHKVIIKTLADNKYEADVWVYVREEHREHKYETYGEIKAWDTYHWMKKAIGPYEGFTSMADALDWSTNKMIEIEEENLQEQLRKERQKDLANQTLELDF